MDEDGRRKDGVGAALQHLIMQEQEAEADSDIHCPTEHASSSSVRDATTGAGWAGKHSNLR